MTSNDPVPEPKGNQIDVLETAAHETKIEAVAGSGKTTTMVARLRKEIEEHGRSPNRLLVLTFAKEASHSIQEKLREALSPAQAFEVDVYNYHSFCYQLLQEYAYKIGLSPDFELITEDRRSQVIESVYDEVDFSFVAPGNPAEGGDGSGTLGELTDFIERMRRETVSPAPIREYLPSDEGIRDLLCLVRDLDQAADNTVNVDTTGLMWKDDELADGCESLARVYRFKAREFSADTGLEDTVTDFLNATADSAENVADHLRYEASLTWKDYRLPGSMFQDDRSIFPEVKQTPFGRLEAFAQMIRRTRAYIGAYEAYLDELDERGSLDYDELIHRTVQLLADDAVSDDILSQWDVVCCDEFQDTDEAQLDLVDALREELEIMVIGDSDQAIHEWRGQDPENMAKLPDSFEEIGLSLNFRSRQPILDMTNNLDRPKQTIEADRTPSPPNVFKIDSESQQTTDQVGTTISNLLTGRFPDVDSLKLSNIAVLVRRNSQARDIAKQLDAASIPYSVSGSTENDLSAGIRTVLSYLRILITPADDVSWQRVLFLLYRVPESDVDLLLECGDSIPNGYTIVSPDELEQPERVEQAFLDYDELQSISATHSISELYMHLKKETKIEWYLTETDRAALGNIERLISSFSDSPVQSRLTEDVVSYLERQAHQLSEGGHTATDQGSRTENAVDIMTIHQAKGLDFDTVLLPFLTEDDFGGVTLWNYQENLYSYDILVESTADSDFDPLVTDLREAQIAEEWRILHVALTRAENRLFLFGNDVSDGRGGAAMIDSQLPGAESPTPIHWSSEGPRIRIWEALMDSYDQLEAVNSPAVRDYTDIVNRGVDEDAGNITYYGNTVSTGEAIEKLLQAADQFVAGTLADVTTDTSDFDAAPLGGEPTAALARQHSHSALEAVRSCERRHVLDYVVNAFPDPQTNTPGSVGAEQRATGTLFHHVAELAYWRGYTTGDEWKDACEWLANTEETTAVLEETKNCIDTFFRTDAAGWKAVGAEAPVDIDGLPEIEGSVTGYIDSVREHPGGGLAVLDYKTSLTQKTIEDSQQLILYVKACQERFDMEITHAGYVYVGDAGPDVQLFDVSTLEDRWTAVLADLEAADGSTFENATAGPHCKFCEHQSLDCSGPEHAYEDTFNV